MAALEARGRRHVRTLAVLFVLASVMVPACGDSGTARAVTSTPGVPGQAAIVALARSVAEVRAAVDGSPVLSPAQKAGYDSRLNALAAGLPAVRALQRQIAGQSALLHVLDDQRAVAVAGLNHLRGVVQTDLRALSNGLALTTAVVSATAQGVDVTATVAISTASLDLQSQTAELALTIQVGAHVLGLLTVSARTHLDALRLNSRLHALATAVHLNLRAILRDLKLLARADATAASDAQGGLAAGLAAALIHLDANLIGTIDARQSLLRLSIAHLQARITQALGRAAITVGMVSRDVIADEVATAPLSATQQRPLAVALGPVGDALRDAASVSGRLAGRLADVGALQDAQARIDREVQKAQTDLDGELARTDAALQGRLRSDVTVAISTTEQTVHVHLDTIAVGALVRDLAFNVKLGLSVLQIAALQAEVTPSTRTFKGSARAQIRGVDLLLRARLNGLQARIRTDVAAVRAEQVRLSAAIRKRVASLRATLSNILAPLIARYQRDVSQLQRELDRALGRATTGLRTVRRRLVSLTHPGRLQGRVIAGALAPLHRAPALASPVDGWVPAGTLLPVVGYVWGPPVAAGPRGGMDARRWYIVRNLLGDGRYLYVPGAMLAVSSCHDVC